MENLIAFLGLGSLIGLSMMFALWLEWMSLRVLLHLMPGRARERQVAAMQPVAVEATEVAAPAIAASGSHRRAA